MSTVSFEEFQKMDIRIAKIEKAERVEGTDKLVKLQVNMGNEKRQLVAGIAHQYEPKKLVGKQIPILANLEPKSFKGIESRGMILVAESDGKITLITPEKDVAPGAKVR